MKTCACCKESFPLEEFPLYGKYRGSYCVLCRRKKQLASYYKHREKRLAGHKEWKKRTNYKGPRGDVKAQQRRYRERYPEKVKARREQWKADNPEKHKEGKRRYARKVAAKKRYMEYLCFLIWVRDNPADYQQLIAPPPKKVLRLPMTKAERARRATKAKRAWELANPDKAREARARKRRRRRKDPTKALCDKIRSRVLNSIKGRRKCAKTLVLIGLPSWGDLVKHLESTWQEGMSWDNYGYEGWHIDHIKPCCSFDMSDPEQQRQCWHYSNLQALWAHENVHVKGGRTDYYD